MTSFPTTEAPKFNNNRLRVYWNVPTNQCRSKRIPFENLQQFGIIQNEKDDFRGDKIVIFYDPGLFPAIFQNQTSGQLRYRNGGVPQEGDLEVHLESFRAVVNQTIPDTNFRGIAIIDFESWRPIFRQNWGEIQLYKEVSYKIEKRKHWFWPEKWIHVEAKERFEKAARIFMQNTISQAKKMRPHAVWGYYGFPYCFNMAGDHMTESCAKGVEGENDHVYWLWSESTALYPSVYSSNNLSTYQLGKMIKGRIQEAARVKRYNTPILPYFWFRYREGGFLREVDLQVALQTFNQSEASGFIVWGSSHDVNTIEKCQNLHDYIYKVFGPAIAKYAKSFGILEDELNPMNDWLENNTTDEYLDTETEIEYSTTDITTYVTDEDTELSTMTTSNPYDKRETTDGTTPDSWVEDENVGMKSLIDILLNQIFNGNGVEVNDTLVEQNENSENVESLLLSTICNLPETSTSQGINENSVKLENRTKPLSTDSSTETWTEIKLITEDNWTSIISDTYTNSGPSKENSAPTQDFSDSTETTNTESMFDSLTEYLPTESNLYLERTEDNFSKNSKKGIPLQRIGNPNHEFLATTDNISTETYTEKTSVTIKDNTYLDPSITEDLNSSTNTEYPTTFSNYGRFETTDSIISSTSQNRHSEASTYSGIVKENLSKDLKKGKPTKVFTTTENTMSETNTDFFSKTTRYGSTAVTESIYLASSLNNHLSKDTKKGKPKDRPNNIDTNDIFFHQNTFNQDNTYISNNEKQNEEDYINNNQNNLLKDLKKGLPRKDINKKEETTLSPLISNSSNSDGTEIESENSKSTIGGTVQDDYINKERSSNIQETTFTVTSPPESLTSGTSDQVPSSAPLSRSKYIFCLIFYFSVSKCLCDYNGQC
ncbi:hypothetical protein O0L34_g1793 [Tuta absoluta]|nr:hypothetical protein O0L34_g1793 [Tuta absoluta]